LLTAACGTIGLGDDANHGIWPLDHLFKGGRRDLRRAHENDPPRRCHRLLVELANEKWLFRVYCEDVFTTKNLARQSRNPMSEYLSQRRKGRKGNSLFRTWRSWRLGEINIRIRVAQRFAQAAQILNHTKT
jgi:hypothetical protein